MKKTLIYATLLLTAGLTACNGDFEDWAEPQRNAQEQACSFSASEVTPVSAIDFAQVTDVDVKVCDIAAPTSDNEAFLPTGEYKISLGNETYDITPSGYMDADALHAHVVSLYGKRPVTRTVNATLITSMTDGNSTVKLTTPFEIQAIPAAPVIEEAYYIVGGINGWNGADDTYKLTNGGGDVYDNPVFTITIPAETVGDGFEFKLFPQSTLGTGDWNECLASAGEEGKFNYHNQGGNLLAEGGNDKAKYYRISFNMLDMTYSVEAICFEQFVYFIGSTDGWSSSEQRLESPANDGYYSGYIYLTSTYGDIPEFKFQRVAGSWDNEINYYTFTSVEGALACGDGNSNILATEGFGVYYFEMNLADLTLKATRITNMNLVGDFNSWNAADDSQQMTWDAENYCYTITGAQVTDKGWKFTANNDWAINLGGDILALTQGGGNLSQTGSTIKLYPCRKGADSIYATVE